ncbi:SPBC2A9.03, partial [Cucurbita argyrosperma subsp. argyrosperma]
KPEFTAVIQRRAGNGRFKETGGFAESPRGVPTCSLHVTTPLPFTEPTQSPFRPVPSRSVSAIKATALLMEHFQNDDLAVNDFDDGGFFSDDEFHTDQNIEHIDSDFEDGMDTSTPKTDTSAFDARNGKDIQGIPWERFAFTRDNYREKRLSQYKNYESLSRSRVELEKECLQVEKGNNFYDFQFNTRLVKSTIVHFQLVIHRRAYFFRVMQVSQVIFSGMAMNAISAISAFKAVEVISEQLPGRCYMLRNLLWATSKHDVYLMQNYSVMHWSPLLRRGKEVLNVAKQIVPTVKRPGVSSQSLSRVQISAMSVKENLIVAGGFQGELICKYLNHPGVAFCTKMTTEENAITNAVDIFHNPNGAMRIVTGNNDAKVRIYDAKTFACLNGFTFGWSVNNTSVSPDGRMLAVLGDTTECLLADANSGKVIESLKGHLDYSFASAWHPDGNILATGNQDTTCRLWDVRNTSKSLAVLKGRMGAIRCVKFSLDGKFLSMAEPADFVHIYESRTGYEQAQEIDLFGEIAGISFSPDTEALFVGVADRTYGSVLEFNKRHHNKYVDSIF